MFVANYYTNICGALFKIKKYKLYRFNGSREYIHLLVDDDN